MVLRKINTNQGRGYSRYGFKIFNGRKQVWVSHKWLIIRYCCFEKPDLSKAVLYFYFLNFLLFNVFCFIQ
jgi:hypothetical protein